MCTLTWIKNDSSYEVFFNRDELLTRQEELPPLEHQLGSVRFLAPTDPQGGGTWIGVNDYGVTLCLANLYPSNRVEGVQYNSRGQLLWSLLSSQNLKELVFQIKDKNLKDYLGFRMAGFSLKENVHLIEYDGNNLKINIKANDCYPVTSSSFQSLDVQNARIKYFEDSIGRTKQLTSEILEDYQNSQYPALSPYSVCMKRDNACTKSYSRIRVDEKNISFIYQPYPWKKPKPSLSKTTLVLQTSGTHD